MDKSELEKRFIKIIQQYERVIYKVCSFYASDEEPLCDLYQDIVCNLWTAYPKFRNECSISTWIYRVALNTCISDLRKRKRSPQSNDLSQLQDAFIQPDERHQGNVSLDSSTEKLRACHYPALSRRKKLSGDCRYYRIITEQYRS